MYVPGCLWQHLVVIAKKAETIKCPSAMDKNEAIVNTIQKNEVTIMYSDGGKVNNILISRKKNKFHKKYVWFIIKKVQTMCVYNINTSLSMQSKTSGMIHISQCVVSIF